MPEQFPNNVWDRKKWQTERDKAGVKKGASSKASVGDELDKFHKEFAKDIVQGCMAAKKLDDKVKAYVADLKKSKDKETKDWAAKVEKQLLYEIGVMVEAGPKLAETRQKYNEGVAEAQKTWRNAKLEATTWLAGKEPRQKFVSPNFKLFLTALDKVATHALRVRFLTDAVDKSVQVQGRKLWRHMDGDGDLDRNWVDETDALVKGLAAV